jgi:hypothetical protein
MLLVAIGASAWMLAAEESNSVASVTIDNFSFTPNESTVGRERRSSRLSHGLEP